MAGPIRQPIDLDKLQKYLDVHVPDVQTPVDVKQFGYGQSNPTYLLTSPNGSKHVLRKKPPGKLVSKTAHQVEREYRIIYALRDTDVPVPKALCLCEDTTVIGTSFYIMSFLNGRIFEDPSFPDVSAEHRREMWKSAVNTLAKFHRVKPANVGLETFGKPDNFYNRQLRTFATISQAQAAVTNKQGEAVGQIPHYDEMVDFFRDPATQPIDRGTFVHGDYKIDNLVFHPTEPYVIGILDWEMATIGHPLSDIGNLLGPYTAAAHPIARRSGRANPAFVPGDMPPGLPSKAQCIEWYHETVNTPTSSAAEQAGVSGGGVMQVGWRFSTTELLWADAFSLYRGAVICQGIAARFAAGQASSAKAREYAVQMGPMGEMCWSFIQDFKKELEKEAHKAKL